MGTLAAVDPNPDPNPSYTFTLVAGAGSDDNASFQINGANLMSAAAFVQAQQSTFKIRVHVENGRPNGAFEKA